MNKAIKLLSFILKDDEVQKFLCTDNKEIDRYLEYLEIDDEKELDKFFVRNYCGERRFGRDSIRALDNQIKKLLTEGIKISISRGEGIQVLTEAVYFILDKSDHIKRELSGLSDYIERNLDQKSFKTWKIDYSIFSVRIANCLKASEVKYYDQLMSLYPHGLWRMRNIGKESIKEVEEILILKGFIK